MTSSFTTAQPDVRLDEDGWLGDKLGKSAYRLVSGPQLTGEAARAALADLAGPFFVGAKIPVDRPETAAALAAAGFLLVDTNVVLDAEGSVQDERGATTLRVRDARPEDVGPVTKIARESFSVSRFHVDPAVPRSVADDIKAGWVANYFTGARGDSLAVALDGERACGFLLGLHASPGELVIDLLAVSPQARRRGVGAALVDYVWERHAPSRMRVGTQLANVSSLRFYQEQGFRVMQSSYVFHRHEPEAELHVNEVS